MRKINLIIAAMFFVATMFFCLPRADAFCIQHNEKDICFSTPSDVTLTGKLLTDKPMPTITKYLKYFWCEAIYKDVTVMFCVLVDVGHYKPVGAFIQYMGSDTWPRTIYYMWDKLGNIVRLGKMADLEEVINEYKIQRGG